MRMHRFNAVPEHIKPEPRRTCSPSDRESASLLPKPHRHAKCGGRAQMHLYAGVSGSTSGFVGLWCEEAVCLNLAEKPNAVSRLKHTFMQVSAAARVGSLVCGAKRQCARACSTACRSSGLAPAARPCTQAPPRQSCQCQQPGHNHITAYPHHNIPGSRAWQTETIPSGGPQRHNRMLSAKHKKL